MWSNRFASSLTFNHAQWAALVIALALTTAAILGGLAQGLERELRQWRDSLQISEASGAIAIVEIDGRSLQAIDSWPWPRSIYADALARLDAMDAGQIAFDVDFSSRSAPAEDQALADQLAAMDGSVILPTFRQNNYRSGQTIVTETIPLPAFADHAFLASVNVHPQADGKVNFYPYGVQTGGIARPSLASMLAGKQGHIGEEFRIDQAIDPTTIPRISFLDLLEGRVPRGQVAGRNIIIGATAIELGDRYPTGLYGVIPGVLVQAQAAETLLQGRVRSDASYWIALAVAAAAYLAIALRPAFISRMPRLGLLACGTTLAAALLLDAFSLLYWPLAPALLLTGSFLLAGRAFKAAIKLRDARLTDSVSGLPNRQALITLHGRLTQATIAVARIADIEQIEAALPASHASSIKTGIDTGIDTGFAARIALLAQSGKVYRLDRGLFGWVVPLSDAGDLAQYFAGIRAMLNAPIAVASQQLKIEANFGTSALTVADAIAASENAYISGAVWSATAADLQEKSQTDQKILLELDEALLSGAIWVAYQPKYRFIDGSISGAECLVRWNSPAMGMIGPDQFIPVLERKGRMRDLTLFVLRDALAHLIEAGKIGRAFRRFNLAVNVSAPLLADAEFVDEVVALLHAHRYQSDGLITIEITESAPLADPNIARAALEKISAAGARISIDDYGTGQATLTYLQGFPAHEVKLDQSFVRDFTSSKPNEIMVRSTIEMAHALGFQIVAEGIEDGAILDALAALGCDYGQGWHIGKPVAWEAFVAEHLCQRQPRETAA